MPDYNIIDIGSVTRGGQSFPSFNPESNAYSYLQEPTPEKNIPVHYERQQSQTFENFPKLLHSASPNLTNLTNSQEMMQQLLDIQNQINSYQEMAH